MALDHKRFTEQLQQLIAIPSISCTNPDLDMGNRAVIDLLASWLEDLGFEIDIQVIGTQPAKANLIAILQPQVQQDEASHTASDPQGGLVFAGHADTVPYDQKQWEQDPFELTIKDERAYGLGATDMKGFFPTVIAAIEPFLTLQRREPIIIIATADEETNMTGARALASKPLPKARYAVIGEPTSMQPIRMHKGMAMESIHVRGQSGHSSNPSLGNNALDVMHEVITELKQFRQGLQVHKHPGFHIQTPTLNLGCIHGGDNPNRICGHCELAFDLRPVPGMSLDDLRQDIDKKMAILAEKYEITIDRESLFSGVAPFEQTADCSLIRTVERLTGLDADSVAFATEAPFLQNMGMEVVVMGPGSIDQAHQPNEYIALEQIAPAVKVMQGLIQQYCVEIPD